MHINNINNTNFQGIYRIKNSPAIKNEIKNKVTPMYQMVSNNPVIIFSGKNPFKIGLDILMNLIADSQNSSKTWLEMNAKNHGLDLSAANIGDDILHIITDKKDIDNLIEYMINRIKKTEPTFKTKIMNFLGINKTDNYGIKNDTPKHLKPLFIALSKNEAENVAFEEYTKGKVINVDSPKELLTKLLLER